MRRSDVAARTLLLAAGAFTAAALSAQTGAPALTAEAMTPIAFRSLGPSLTTGRISDVAVDPKNPSVWYIAAASGNLWKTENRGNTWTAVFDDYGSYSLGAVTVDPKDSNVVWLGTGENNNQRSVAFGDGIYKSTDAGKTWKRMGLENSEHIQNILIDPAQLERRLRQRDRAAVVVGRRSRAVQDHRRRSDVEIGAVDQRRHRRHRSRDGSEESRRPLRRRLSAAPRRRTADWRWARERALQVDQCRSDLDEADEGIADRRARAHRAGDQLAQSAHALRARDLATRAGRILQVGRCRGDVVADRAG